MNNSSSLILDCGGIPHCKKIFILNDSSTDAETQDLCDILNKLSRRADGERAFTCHSIQNLDKIVDNLTNWVVSEINDSAIVLLVCSFEMCNCLMQVNNPKYLDVTTGSLGGNYHL